MKKQLFFLTLATLVLLSGCQSNTNSSSSPSPSPNTTTTAQVEVTPTPSPTVSPIEQRLDVDFRNAKWGDSIETTHKYEVEIDLQESDDQLSACRFAFLLFHSASCCWICAQSRSMISHSCAVARVAKICPRNPLAYS